VRIVFLVGGALIVAGLLVQPIVGRIWPRYADPVRLVRMVLTQGVVAVAFGWIAIGLAQEGGPLFVGLAVLCAALAIGALLMGALFVWGFAKDASGEDG
jgi:uncharacterized membrane protein